MMILVGGGGQREGEAGVGEFDRTRFDGCPE
jgi:hypothetical protein